MDMGEKFANIAASELGIPLANVALPTISQLLFQAQVLKLPVNVPYFHYYDEFILNYKFSETPRFVSTSQNSL